MIQLLTLLGLKEERRSGTKFTIPRNYLAHHGILGQKWGVRRFQNEDGSLTEAGRKRYGNLNTIDADGDVIIKKGSTISSVSVAKKIKFDDRGMYGYDANDEVDKSIYEGIHSYYKRHMDGAKDIFKHTFVNSEDLVLPSRKKKVDAFIELLSTDEEFKKGFDEINRPFEDPTYYKDSDQIEIEKRYDDFAKRTGLTSLNDRRYQRFIHGLNLPGSMPLSMSKKFVDKLFSLGYNAIVDDADAGYYFGAHNPIFVFNARKSLRSANGKHVSKGQKQSIQDMQKEYDKAMDRHDNNK